MDIPRLAQSLLLRLAILDERIDALQRRVATLRREGRPPTEHLEQTLSALLASRRAFRKWIEFVDPEGAQTVARLMPPEPTHASTIERSASVHALISRRPASHRTQACEPSQPTVARARVAEVSALVSHVLAAPPRAGVTALRSPMDRQGLSSIKRAELIARLELLERHIEKQETRIARLHASGRDAKDAEKWLDLLRDSHRLYRSALVHLLGEDVRGAAGDAAPDAS